MITNQTYLHYTAKGQQTASRTDLTNHKTGVRSALEIPQLFMDSDSSEQSDMRAYCFLLLLHLQVNSLHTSMQSITHDHILCAFQSSGPSYGGNPARQKLAIGIRLGGVLSRFDKFIVYGCEVKMHAN